MLSFAEEIYLLALDDVSGKIIIPSKETVLNTALAGAVLSELSFMGRIDTDTEMLYLTSKEPTGNRILDEVIKILQNEISDGKAPLYHCMKVLLPKALDIENYVLENLIAHGILKKVEEKILWIFPQRRYPIIDSREITDVETRLREIVLGDEIPDPRECVLISLIHNCDLFKEILSPKELRRCSERIEDISKLDAVGREVAQLIDQINAFMSIPPYV
ncbi:MAG: hypothetical protein A2020_02365 [Lentisphaerae bacterium GWF2_45_14]|nr:MAG: hypothetical protein A2020_02365 [Lentisphaerae bacterium GWF2_45_14]